MYEWDVLIVLGICVILYVVGVEFSILVFFKCVIEVRMMVWINVRVLLNSIESVYRDVNEGNWRNSCWIFLGNVVVFSNKLVDNFCGNLSFLIYLVVCCVGFVVVEVFVVVEELD